MLKSHKNVQTLECEAHKSKVIPAYAHLPERSPYNVLHNTKEKDEFPGVRKTMQPCGLKSHSL